MKKIIFFSLAFLGMLITTNTLFAQNEEYGTVTDITESTGDSLIAGQGSIEISGNTTTIRYASSTFKMLEEDEEASDGERPGPAAWIGFEVSKPENEKDTSFKVTTPDNKTEQIKKYPYRDYVGITPENLKKSLINNEKLTYKYSFDWDEDDKIDQYVIVEIDPQKITLIPTDNKDAVWSPTIAKEILDSLNPKTSDINIYVFIALIIVSSLALIYNFKKSK